MKYLLRVVYERFYEVEALTLSMAKENAVERTVKHICSLSETDNHTVFRVETYDLPDIENCPGRRKDDVTIYPIFKSKGL